MQVLLNVRQFVQGAVPEHWMDGIFELVLVGWLVGWLGWDR